MSTPVVLVAGLHPGSVAVHHDLQEVTSGRVRREVRDASAVPDLADVRLAHGCVTCTVREDLLPELVRHAATASLLVVDLWDSVEPRSVAEALDCEEARGKIRSRRVTGVTVEQQRRLARAVKNAREMALLPYASQPRS